DLAVQPARPAQGELLFPVQPTTLGGRQRHARTFQTTAHGYYSLAVQKTHTQQARQVPGHAPEAWLYAIIRRTNAQFWNDGAYTCTTKAQLSCRGAAALARAPANSRALSPAPRCARAAPRRAASAPYWPAPTGPHCPRSTAAPGSGARTTGAAAAHQPARLPVRPTG